MQDRAECAAKDGQTVVAIQSCFELLDSSGEVDPDRKPFVLSDCAGSDESEGIVHKLEGLLQVRHERSSYRAINDV